MEDETHLAGARVTYYVARRFAERLEMQSSEQPEAGTVIAVREAAGGSFEYDIQRDSGMRAAPQLPTHSPASSSGRHGSATRPMAHHA